jgi:negative regulator of sigma E activity
VQKSAPQSIKEILSFSAHADSGNMPGAAVMGPVGVVAGAGTAVIVGVNVVKGAAATCKSNSPNQAPALDDKISEVLQKHFQKQGWIK